MKVDDVNKFEKLSGQLEGLHKELLVLVKKNPNTSLNKFKLALINKLIIVVNSLLGEKYLPLEEFDGFDESQLPSTSDVSMVISQYIECCEVFRSDHITAISPAFYKWILDVDQVNDDGTKIVMRTAPPKKVSRR